jgi:hypothetical protein
MLAASETDSLTPTDGTQIREAFDSLSGAQ